MEVPDEEERVPPTNVNALSVIDCRDMVIQGVDADEHRPVGTQEAFHPRVIGVVVVGGEGDEEDSFAVGEMF